MRKLALITVLGLASLSISLTSGCVYRSSIVQGNDINQRAVDRLETGMTRDQVRALLGSPLIQDQFHPNRWDYVFYTKNLPTSSTPKKVTVHFDKIGTVSKIDR